MTKNSCLFLFVLLLGFGTVSGQGSFNLSGTVVDTLDKPLPTTTVVLLNSSDSTMVKFSLTNAEGKFAMTRIPSGKYILQLSYLGYQNFSLNVEIGDKNKDIGIIKLAEDEVLLNDVTITDEALPIVFKKDTIEYNAASFNTQPDAVVEDLLKKLPGVEVEQDGTVKAQGEDVEKVLVDGKEFFGDDPKMATKNLPANAVDKVQVFDKKSDMSEFTGIDDGERIRTINLKLKEGHKKGVFGNVMAGYGTPQDRFTGKANINRFTKKTQTTILGMANNTNEQGFSIDDYINFMGGLNNLMANRGSGILRSSDLGIPLQSSLSNGLVTTGAGGANFNYTPSKKTLFNLNYFFNGMRNDITRNLYRQSFIEGTTFTTEEQNIQDLFSANHRLNLRLRQDLDSLQRITVNASGTLTEGTTETDDDRTNFGPSGFPETSNRSTKIGDGTNYSLSGNAMYVRKFHRIGRAFNVNVSGAISSDKNDATFQALNEFFETDSVIADSSVSIDQIQNYLNANRSYSAKASWTEPLNRGRFINLSYSRSEYQNNSDKDFFDIDTAGFETLNTFLSNEYDNRYTYDNGTALFQLNRSKLFFSSGVAFQQSRLNGNLITYDTTIAKTFNNVLPSLQLKYSFTNTRRLTINYSTNVNEPSIEQLSPVIDNTDPLKLTVGNPDLRAEYNHRIRLMFMNFSAFSFTSFFANINLTYTTNNITNTVTTDSNFIQTIIPVNVASRTRLTSYMGFGAPIKPIKCKINLNGRSTFIKSIVFINGVENTSDRWVNSISMDFENRKKEKIDWVIGGRVTHNLTKYSVSQGLDQTYFTYQGNAEATWNITKRLILNSNFSYTLYTGDAFEESQAIPLWRGFIGYYFSKGNKFLVKAIAFDILNQNSGVTRTSELNYIEEEQYITIGRYYMLSLSYSIRGFKQNKRRGMHFMRRRSS